MLVCLRSWLSDDIWVRRGLCYLLFVAEFELKYHILVGFAETEKNFV